MKPTPSGLQESVEILVVDDIEQNRIAMRALLERPGVRVLCAENGVQALETLLEHDVALALVDVQMPGMGGFELAELMRGAERTRAVPIVFVTAATADAQRSFRGYEAGAVDFLYKPIDPRVLCGKVDVFVDLHARRRELQRRMEELEQALSLNETMVAVLSHDLRTPLSAISLSAEVLERTAVDDATRQSAIRIKSGAARMTRMIAWLLDLSRIRSGMLPLELRQADLAAIFESAAAELRQAVPGARIELKTLGDTQATLDPDRMVQVASNLLSNAVRHGEAGGLVQVTVDGSRGDVISAEVANPGSIAAGIEERLFEPFRMRASGGGGLGLGLYIVDCFVRAHHGSVRVDTSGEGRVAFGFGIPRRQPPGALQEPVTARGPDDA